MKSRVFDQFFESNLCCAVLLDRDFNFIRVNQAYAQACGRDASEFPGHNHFELYPSDALAIFEDVRRTRRAFSVRARPFEFPDHPEWGMTYWDWNLVPILDDRGDVELLLFCLNDVTEYQRANERVRQVMAQFSKLSSQMADVQENERRRLAGILHDEIGQELAAIKLTIQNCIKASPGDTGSRLRDALAGINEIIGRTRQLSVDLRPPVLDDLGLIPALVWLIGRKRSLTGLDVSFRHDGLDGRLPQQIETAVYRIVQEALTNVIRHAGVQQACLDIRRAVQSIFLRIEDHGCGFDTNAAPGAGVGSGLMGMRERARSLGGRVFVESTPGAGTMVTAELPLGEPQRTQ